MTKSTKLQNRLDKIEREVIPAIVEIVSREKSINLEDADLYLGEYQSHLCGYPQVERIQLQGDEIVVITNDEDKYLEDYSVPELICILENIEE